MASFYITTLGCHKNQADSRQINQSMRMAGFVAAGDARSADYHLVNSCAFVESAREETIQVVLESANLKKTSNQKLILVGCFSERYSTAVHSDLPEVDFFFGTGKYDQSGPLIVKKFKLESVMQPNASALDMVAFDDIWAPVKIADGCNRKCAFCAIPRMRGKFRSTNQSEIIAEVTQLAKSGVKEICLVSQDTNQYGSHVNDFMGLLEQLHEIDGPHWIRLLYMYPDKKTLAIYRELARRKLPKVVPYLESPVQHASPKILKAMNRYVDPDGFVDFFQEIRSLIANIEIRTSILCGFPGENNDDFAMLEKFLFTVKPEKLALFSYSHEEGTSGFKLNDDVKPDQKQERLDSLRTTHLQILKEHHKSRIGQTYQCMIDKIELDKTLVVRRAQDAPQIDEIVYIDAKPDRELEPGSLVQARINGFFEYDMSGTLV